MNKKIKKLISVLLCCVMLIGVLPLSAFAEGGSSTVTNGQYTDGVWAASGTGSATYDVDGTNVTLSKTAAPVEGMENTFDITLTVQTSTSTSQQTPGGAVVLVIDTSSSMKSCSECGGRDKHNGGCEQREGSSVSENQSRLVAAQAAARTFLASYAGTDASANRMLAIVTFDGGYRTKFEWANVAGGADKNSYNAALTIINGLGLATGTNMEGGLYNALVLVGDAAVSSYAKNVVLLSDGAPSVRMDDSRVGPEQADCTAAATQATAIKNAGATLYTVCFGANSDEAYFGGPTVGNFLRDSIASSGCAYTADNSAQLNAAFAAISESITSGLSGDGWTATDPMADKIGVVVDSVPANFTSADGDTYTWTLSSPTTSTTGNVTTYTYTCTYRVELDVQSIGFEENKYYPTNGPTYLNIDGKQYAFPVPGVQGVLPRTDVTVTKEWVDVDNQDGIRPGSVTVRLTEDGAVISDAVVLDESNGWTHTWTDLIEKSEGSFHKYSVVEDTIEGYTASATDSSDGNFDLVITNTHEINKKDITVTKTWDDNDDQDGIRPNVIKVKLLADGLEVAAAELKADDWTYTFHGFPVNRAGKVGEAIVYTVEEETVAGYEASYNGLTITNTHAPEKTAVSVTKVWDDKDDQDGIRPNDITVKLLADGADTGKTLILNQGNNWTGSFTELDKYKAGTEIKYTVAEVSVTGYTSSVTGGQENGYTITNSHIPEIVEVAGSKTWNDNNNQDGARPKSITINLLADGAIIKTITVTEADGWTWSFTGLPKNKDHGTAINYSITEESVEDYSATYNGYNVTNTHTPAKTSVTVTKSWQDSNDQDGARPNDITVTLVADGVETNETLVLNAGNGWTGSFTELDKYAAGELINYSVKEVAVPGYETVITGDMTLGYTITNTHTPETVDVTGSKTWDDNDNQDGARPESITINLRADGEVIDTITVTEADGWAWSFTGLAKYKDHGTAIEYSITEESVENYSTTYNGYNVTNTHTPEKTSVTVTKSWKDNNDQDGIRPNDITVKLLADGADTGKTLILNQGNNWTGSFTELDKYADGEVITYTVAEVTVAGYNTVITGDQNTGYTVTNSHTPETVEVSGSKTWVDNNDQDGFRPDSITINLLKNGKVINSLEVTERDNWSWSFTELPKYENKGTLINYSVTEEAVDGYTTTYDGYDVTNTHAPEKTSVTVTKAWQDNSDQDGIRPNDITVKLLAGGVDTGKTMVLSQGNNWTGSFTDLDKYAAGEIVNYTVEELAVEGYNTVITGTQSAGYTITNSHTPEVFDITGSKIWDDNDNQDGARPQAITVNLLANGNVVETAEVTEADEWSWTFTNLPKYENGGNEIIYTVTEEAVEDYSTEYEGYDIINTHTPEKTSVTVAKAWADSNDQDGIRPKAVTVVLLANGEETRNTLNLNADNNWTGSFTELDKFADGEEIVYSVKEVEVEGYSVVITGNQKDGYVITNTHAVELTAVEGSKTWDDNNNQDGVRPASITVNLLANGKVVNTLEVTAEDNWSWSFTGLPKYENGGNEIVYTVTENAVEGYTTSYDGFNVINSYDPEKISITVNKAWADSNDAEGIRPNKVTIKLYADGEDTGLTLTLKEDNSWKGTFADLDKYADGKQIEYTIVELAVKGYNTVVTGSAEKGFIVTNSHTYIPQTGDERTPVLWISLMAVSMLMIAFAATGVGKKRSSK